MTPSSRASAGAPSLVSLTTNASVRMGFIGCGILLRLLPEAQQELAVSVCTCDGRIHGSNEFHGWQVAQGKFAHARERGFLHREVANDSPSLVDRGLSCFELRLHERHEGASRAHQ